MVFREELRAAVFLRFLRRPLRHSRTPVFLIVVRHPVHRAIAVHRRLAAHAARIRLFFLPACSPGYLEQDIKSSALGRQRFQPQPEMLGARRSAHVPSYFQAKPVQCAAQH